MSSIINIPPVSIHSPHARGDMSSGFTSCAQLDFNPLPSCEGRRASGILMRTATPFQSTPLMRGETGTRRAEARKPPEFQSTPLMRGETRARSTRRANGSNFNPLPSCAGRRRGGGQATRGDHFNPLPSCEGRPEPAPIPRRHENISIHSPHARGDGAGVKLEYQRDVFQSTPLMRGETAAAAMMNTLGIDFNPLPSYEGRLTIPPFVRFISTFQSTPLMRGETARAFSYSP